MGFAILICDDDLMLAEEIAEFFRLNGWRTSVANSFHKATECFGSETTFDCLLTDWLMPQISGESVVAFAIALPMSKVPKVIGVMSGVEVGGPSYLDDFLSFTVMKPFDLKLIEAQFTSKIALPQMPDTK